MNEACNLCVYHLITQWEESGKIQIPAEFRSTFLKFPLTGIPPQLLEKLSDNDLDYLYKTVQLGQDLCTLCKQDCSKNLVNKCNVRFNKYGKLYNLDTNKVKEVLYKPGELYSVRSSQDNMTLRNIENVKKARLNVRLYRVSTL